MDVLLIVGRIGHLMVRIVRDINETIGIELREYEQVDRDLYYNENAVFIPMTKLKDLIDILILIDKNYNKRRD